MGPYVCDNLLRSWVACLRQLAPRRSAHSRVSIVGAVCATNRFRLIDVVETLLVTAWHPEHYIALSYVWGGMRPQSAWFVGPGHRTLRVAALPKTIQDAMRVTLTLGYRYLWVDALCIDQNDPLGRFTVIEAMDLVYRGADITIIAAAGGDADAGLAGVGSARSADSSADNGIGIADLDTALDHSQWDKRGWTFQEHMLSPVCLYFTEHEVFLKSSDTLFRESSGVSQIAQTSLTGWRWLAKVNNRTYERYAAAVMEFSRRDFTFREDQLLAFAGVLNTFATRDDPIKPSDSRHGLVLRHFEKALQWQPVRPVFNKATTDRAHSVALTSVPSWSWASHNGPVRYNMASATVTSQSLFDFSQEPGSSHVFGTPARSISHPCISFGFGAARDADDRNHELLMRLRPSRQPHGMPYNTILWLLTSCRDCRLFDISPVEGTAKVSLDIDFLHAGYEIRADFEIAADPAWLAKQLELANEEPGAFDGGLFKIGDEGSSCNFGSLHDLILIGSTPWEGTNEVAVMLVERTGQYWRRVGVGYIEDMHRWYASPSPSSCATPGDPGACTRWFAIV